MDNKILIEFKVLSDLIYEKYNDKLNNTNLTIGLMLVKELRKLRRLLSKKSKLKGKNDAEKRY